MNILYRERELRHIVGDAEPRAIIVDSRYRRRYPDTTSAVGCRDAERRGATRESTRPVVNLDGDDPAADHLHVGNHGHREGRRVVAQQSRGERHRRCRPCWRITEADRYLAMLPLFHVHGLGNGIHCWLISGCRMRLLERFDHRTTPSADGRLQADARLRRADDLRAPTRPAVVSDEQARAIGTNARLFVSGSAPLPAHVHEAFRAALRPHDPRALRHE